MRKLAVTFFGLVCTILPFHGAAVSGSCSSCGGLVSRAHRPPRTHADVPRPTVEISHGPIRGWTVFEDLSKHQPIPQDVDLFLGLPFARPPVDTLRFRPPMPLHPESRWEGVRDASRRPPSCLQYPGAGCEACLFLNIYRPSKVAQRSYTGGPLPVMIYLLDGNMARGHLGVRNGTALAANHDVIIVNPNYRLGALGYWAAEGFKDESLGTGNLGQLDQRMAMKWVQKHIHAFGGDPNRVTIWGACSGGVSALWHVVSPLSAGLFHRVIISSAMINRYTYPSLEDSERYYDWLARKVGCPSASSRACLRMVDPRRFLVNVDDMGRMEDVPSWANPMYPQIPVGASVDGISLPKYPLQMIHEGNFNKVPMIIGVTRDETRAMVLAAAVLKVGVLFPSSEEDVDKLAHHFFRESTSDLKQMIPVEPFVRDHGAVKGRVEWLIRSMRDVFFHGPSQFLAAAVSEHVPVYNYIFGQDVIPGWISWLPLWPFVTGASGFSVSDAGAFHGVDSPLAWKLFTDKGGGISELMRDPSASYMGRGSRSPGDHIHQLSDFISTFYTNFASSGNPNIRKDSPSVPEGHPDFQASIGVPDVELPVWQEFAEEGGSSTRFLNLKDKDYTMRSHPVQSSRLSPRDSSAHPDVSQWSASLDEDESSFRFPWTELSEVVDKTMFT